MCSFSVMLLPLLVALFLSSGLATEGRRVSTEYGDVIGLIHDKCDVFLSIPYASPPIGELRFEKPIPPKPWSTPLQTTQFGPSCVPHAKEAIVEDVAVSEDCLTLSIITPSTRNEKKLLPVLFYIHGGGFEIGNAAIYGYKAFAEDFAPEGLVVVSIQYRVGVYGFASLGDGPLPGNYGLFDQAAALKFVHRNIEKFGGDPNNIKLFGISGGAASAGMLSISPLTRDLVKGSIEMSGSAFANWANENRVEKHTNHLAEAVGCGGGKRTAKDAKECMKKLSIEQLFDGVKQIDSSDFNINFLKFAPRIDGEFAPLPYEIMAKDAPKIPILTGCHTHEASYFIQWNRAPTIHRMGMDEGSQFYFGRKVFEKYVRILTRDFFNEEEHESAVVDMTNFYAGPPKGEEKTLEKDYARLEKEAPFYLERYGHFWSDISFTMATRMRAIESRRRGSEVYLYLFQHYAKDMFEKDEKVKGSFHANELPYIFNKNLVRPFNWTNEELKLKKEVQEMIVTFTKTGKPSVSNVAWPPFHGNTMEKDGTPYVLISTPQWKLYEGFYDKVADFWFNSMSRYSYDMIRGRKNEASPQMQIPKPSTVEQHEEL